MPAYHNGKGVGIPPQSFTDPAPVLKALGWNPSDPTTTIQWYDWGFKWWNHPTYKDFYQPMIYSNEWADGDEFERAVRGSRQAWMITNEPDRATQANMTPASTLALLVRMKRMNPGLRWMGPNVCLDGDTYSQEWLTKFVQLLREGNVALPEAWAVHCYGLEHTDWGNFVWDSFDKWWDRFKLWMHRNHCERQVFLSEVNGNYRYWPAVHEALLYHIHGLIYSGHEPLLQGYMWFAPHYRIPRQSDLMDRNYNLTQLGLTFKALP